MTRRILRWELQVDDAWHVLPLTGPIVHVATRGEDYVEVWSLEDSDVEAMNRTFRVAGTGQPLGSAPDTHVGTAITPSGELVWHVMEFTG